MMLSDVCLSVCLSTFKVKKSKVKVTGAGHIVAAPTQLVILSPSKIQRGDIPVPADPDCHGKWPFNECRVVSRQSGVWSD